MHRTGLLLTPLLAALSAAPVAAAPVAGDTDPGQSCDRLAAFNDGLAEAPAVRLTEMDATAAISACRAAIAGPEPRPRYHLQIARALLKEHRTADARQHLALAMLHDVAAAYFVLGQMHHLGTGVRQDDDRAMELYLRAYAGGYIPAAFGLLMLYEDPDSRHYSPATAEATRMLLAVNGLL